MRGLRCGQSGFLHRPGRGTTLARRQGARSRGLTKGAPKKLDKSKVKVKFSSDEPNSTYECKLKGKGLDQAVKQFGDCDSPRKYRHLDQGKFKVRAIDAAGKVDPSPAKDKFKVVD